MKTFFQKIFLLGVMMLLTLGTSATPDKDYLCFTANTDSSTVKLSSFSEHLPKPHYIALQISFDGEEWNRYECNEVVLLAKAGDKVYFRNQDELISTVPQPEHFAISTQSDVKMFVMSGSIAASGNVMSLVDKACKATTIPGDCCFMSLFMGCTSLTSAPALPATTLNRSCYERMFVGCTGLTSAPVLPATTLARECYAYMFEDCLQLDRVEVGFTEWGDQDETSNWLNGVSARGNFICPDGLGEVRGASNIPEGWTINGSFPYLNFTANEASSGVQLNMVGGVSTGLPLEYSTDECQTWTAYSFEYDAYSNSSLGTFITLANVGDKVYFRKSGYGVAEGFSPSDNNFYRFRLTGSVAADGNVMSLIDKNAETTTIPSAYCFAHLFEGNLALTKAPELPATTLKPYCYASMFSGCTGLTSAPELPATTLAKDCYKRMFYYCTRLNEIKAGFTDWTVTESDVENTPTSQWLYQVSDDGVFTSRAALDRTQRDDSHIPVGWVALNYRYAITAVSSDESKGSVSGGGTYADGVEVTLTATPAEGYILKQWSDGTTANPYVFTAEKDVTLTAQFAKPYTVQVASADESKGTVSGGGTYAEGDLVTLTATPAEYCVFEQWSDGTTANPYVFTAEKDVNLTASFSKPTYTITVESNGENYGTATGGGTYEAGEVVTLTATPKDGYKFAMWMTAQGNRVVNPYVFIARNDMSVAALFIGASWDFEEGGICYEIKDDGVLTVVGHTNPPADMVIPGTVTHNGKTYRVTTIGDNAFKGCKDLTSVMISNGVQEISAYAFNGCKNLTKVILGADVSLIESGAFADCEALKNVYFWRLTPPTIEDNNLGSDTDWYIPKGATRAYEERGYDTINVYQLKVSPSNAQVVIDGIQYKDGDAVCVGGSLSNPLCNVMQPSDVKKDEAVMFGYDLTSVSIWNGTIHVEYTANSSVVFTDATPYGYANEKTFPELTYSREFSNTEWQALYVPFSMSYDEWKDDYDIARIHNFIEYDDDDNGEFDRTYLVVLKLTSGSTKPNTPYLIRAKKTGISMLYLGERTLQPAETNSLECSSTESTYTFTGTYTGVTDMYAKGYYAMSGGSLQQAASSSVTLKPQRWYMVLTPKKGAPAATKAHSIRILVDGEEGVESLTPDPSPRGRGGESAYDLMGRSVSGAVKGISIVNGKKIIK